MAYNQDDDPNEGPVVVRRPVYDAGMKLEDEVKAGASGPAFENAREKGHECHAAGKLFHRVSFFAPAAFALGACLFCFIKSSK